MPFLPPPTDATALLYVLACLALAIVWDLAQPKPAAYPRRPTKRPATPASDSPQPSARRGRKKPAWVRKEVIRLAALDPHGSCRKIALTFCAKYFGIASVGKSWVALLLLAEKYRIEALRREIRSRKPPAGPRNRTWALDLTAVTGTESLALGILDHGTRACIALQHLGSKHSIVLIRALVGAIRKYGRPAVVRTDNEAVFTSRFFRLGLWLLGIVHERIEALAPWQNGRIERFFGTFKAAWHLFRERSIEALDDVQTELDVFRTWYNHVRPHQHLGGRVPADVWSGTRHHRDRQHDYFCEWEEVLAGFHFR